MGEDISMDFGTSRKGESEVEVPTKRGVNSGRKSEVRRQRSEDRGRRTEVRGPREVRGKLQSEVSKTEVRTFRVSAKGTPSAE